MNISNTKHKSLFDVRRLVFTALLAALSAVLMKFLSFPLPFIPAFITFDFSDVPAMLASLTMGPVSGLAVCLVKNLIGCFSSMTGCVGELSNFILCSCLVVPAGFIAKKTGYKGVIIACIAGAVAMALIGVASNYFIVYPLYTAVMPMEAIIGMYKAILPSVDSLIECLLIFNLPFTFAKGLIAALISVPLYKRLRPIFNSNYAE
ncbi:MAG: ECF transporter S component [Oscillospiraceae bacterium]